jgi:hypothetical protein
MNTALVAKKEVDARIAEQERGEQGFWTEERNAILTMMYPTMRAKAVAEYFGVSPRAIYSQVFDIGLTKKRKTQGNKSTGGVYHKAPGHLIHRIGS